jgi:hypothetical protein
VSLPKTPIKGDPETRRFLEAVRQRVESVESNAVTVADMRSAGFFDRNGINVGSGTSSGAVQAPTIPTNLDADGAFENIVLTWDYVDYVGHSNTRIYRSNTNVFADAEVLANIEGRIYADLVGSNKTYYYWVSNVNENGIESATSQSAGVVGVTLPNTQFILDLLTNSITESQLYSTLGTRINLIDGASTLTGSVNARLNAVQTDLQTQITANGSAIISVQDVNSSQATQITALGTRTGAAESNIVNLQSTTSSQAISLSSLTTRTGVAESNITNLQSTTSSQATSIISLNTRVGSAETSITNLNTTTSNQATSISQLTSTVSGNTTSIQTLTSTTNGLNAQYTVKIDTNGYVSGFGLASTANNATPFSSFIVRADRFSISSPSGPSIPPKTPFIVTTTTTIVNGVSVPAGVYIDSATIQNGSITNAKIGDATIESAKIVSLNADKIVANSLSAITANIGLLRTATTGARLEIESNQIRVYDSSGTMRVRMGVW